ncbi:MAG: T9SS type A sorting domain-containing protein [Bacteroidetes bacterium]|nr:T9SS type A sorting domain-containing protein [Bacteroidota bacterium]
MKTKNTVLTLVAIVISAFAFAANPSKMAVISQQKSGTFRLIYEGATAGKVTLKIYDSSGTEVFAETTNGLSKFMRSLNFDGMDHGVYSIEITDENGKQVQKVNYETASEAVDVINTSKETSFKALHVCKLTEGKYLVSISSDGAEEINIRIFDNDNNLVHNENRTVNGDLGVVYNLKEIGGKPVFMISNGTGKNQTIK